MQGMGGGVTRRHSDVPLSMGQKGGEGRPKRLAVTAGGAVLGVVTNRLANRRVRSGMRHPQGTPKPRTLQAGEKRRAVGPERVRTADCRRVLPR